MTRRIASVVGAVRQATKPAIGLEAHRLLPQQLGAVERLVLEADKRLAFERGDV